MEIIVCLVFTIGLCFYIVYSVSRVICIHAALAAIWALDVLYENSKPVFLLIFDIFAHFNGVSLWWVILGIPGGFIGLWMVFLCISCCCRQDMDERRYRGSEYTYPVPSHGDRTINERTHMMPSYEYRPLVETPQRIIPSPSPYVSRSPIGTAPRVLPTLPSTSSHVAVDPRLSRYTTPVYPSPAVTDRRALRPLDAYPTSGSSMTVAGRQLMYVAWDRTEPAYHIPAHIPRPEVDGMLLHAYVTAEVDDRYLYDQQMKTDSASYSTTRTVVGSFKCYGCPRKKDRPEEPRTWTSAGICVEIWMSSTGRQYRTRLNSQTCIRCHTLVEPDVIEDDYVTKVVRVLDGWTGQHSVVKPLQKYPSTGPHKTDKCNACRKGICPLKATM